MDKKLNTSLRALLALGAIAGAGVQQAQAQSSVTITA